MQSLHQRDCLPNPRLSNSLRRRGTVMVVVLMVVILLSLAAYSFTDMMVSERAATGMYGRRISARTFADSAVEYTAATLDARTFELDENLFHNPEVFFRQQMMEGDTARTQGYFTILVPNERDAAYGTVRYGLLSESGKLDINTLAAIDESDDSAELLTGDDTSALMTLTVHERLMMIPNMTDEVADAILDYIDEDEDPREYGAETVDYTYPIPNAPIESLDELLQVQGMTPWLLYGEDTNRNGLLDKNENDADVSEPAFDNADGILDLGLSAYLTVHGLETNLRSDGTDKIFLNEGVVSDMFDAVEAEMSETEAQFITAFRIYGSQEAIATASAADVGEQVQEAVENIGRSVAGSEDGTVTRAGLDLLQTPQYEINSPFDLIDAVVDCEIDGQPATLQSPFTSANMVDLLPTMYDLFSFSEDPILTGKIDPNHARLEVLMTIPDAVMTENLATSIAASSMLDGNGSPMPDVIAQRITPGWLLIEGLVDLPTMRILAPYLTTRGSVFSAQIVGYFGEGGPITRLDVMIDATASPSTVLSVRDLTNLGKGYSRNHLQSTELNQ